MVRLSQGVSRSVVAVALPVVVLTGCTSGGDSGAAAQPPSTSTPATSSSSTTVTSSAPGSTSPSSSTTSTPAGAAAGTVVPVYWTGGTARRPVLYREFVSKRGDADDEVTTALTAMMSRRPTNPAWKSVWRSPKRLSVRRVGDAVTVGVSRDAFAATGVSAQQATAAVQQLVWTATAAAHSSAPVTVTVDGKKGYRAWNVLPLGSAMKRADSARAPIWIDRPAQGDTVNRGKVTVSGTANVVEGNVVVMLKDAAGKVLSRTPVQGGAGTFAPYRTTLTINTPGNYTLTAYEPDESEGEGSGGAYPHAVTTTFTVR